MTELKYKILAKKLNIKHYFTIEYKMLHSIGIDLNSKERTLERPWVTCSAFCCLFAILIAMAHFSWNHINEVDLVTDALGPFVQGSLAMWKCVIFIYKRKELVGVVHRVWEQGMEATESELKIIAKENKQNSRLSLLYCKIVFSTILAVLSSPIYIGTFAYFYHGEFVYKPPMTASYPFEIANPINFLLLYMWTIIVIHFVTANTVGIDCLYWWCITNLAAQFKVVQFKIESLAEIEATANAELMRENIAQCIKQHQQAIELVAQLNRGFWPIIVAEFTLNSAQLCFLGFQVGRGLDMVSMPYLLSFMVTVMMQLLLYSYGGEHLQDESENVALTCFRSTQWQFWPVSAKKLLLLLIIRAQKPCQITAFFFFVNMQLFVWVLQTAVSYITLLRSVGPV